MCPNTEYLSRLSVLSLRGRLEVPGQKTRYERTLQGSDLFAEMHVVHEGILTEFPCESVKVENWDVHSSEKPVCYEVVFLLIGSITMKFHVGSIMD